MKESERELEEFSDDFQVRHWAQRRAIGKKLYPFILAEERRQGREEARRNEVVLTLNEGMVPLVRLFERRLRRPLTEAEHAILRERWTTVGPLRLVDLALDLSSKQLGRWLADPEAEYTLVDSD